MTPDRGYAFDQKRDEGASDSNNRQFAIVNEWLCKMQEDGVFERRGVSIFNCCERSGLRAFPYVPFDIALKDVVGRVEEQPDLRGWYEKADCPECKSKHVNFDKICVCVDCGYSWNV